MGIDPGTNFMGYAILRTTGKNSRPELVVSGVVDMYNGYSREPCKSLTPITRTN